MSVYDIKDESMDDYWDIDKLVPKRRSGLSPFASSSPTSQHTVRSAVSEPQKRPDEERRISFEGMRGIKEEETLTYTPDDHGLIRRVTITKVVDRYDFYDSFRKAALLYYDCPASKCDFVQFYSYMPQYSHLTSAQRAYYFYWRQEVRNGRYIKSDYSYIYLYAYEILNLPDIIPPNDGLRMLCDVWRVYRKELHHLDVNFAAWVQDYCLVHQLPCPLEYIGEFLFECINASALKEFYISDLTKVGVVGVEPLLACLSDYDWRRGKFADGNSAKNSIIKEHKDYKEQMLGAMYILLSAIWESDIIRPDAELFSVERSAFPHSLCTHSVKSRLKIEHIYLVGNEALRRSITAAVRYTENKLRALLGVKSRLGVKDLPENYKAIIDNYFEAVFRREQAKRREENRSEYEHLYEAPRETLSFEGADEIERASWVVTARLVESDDDSADSSDREETVDEEDAVQIDRIDAEDCYGLSDLELGFLSFALGLPNNKCLRYEAMEMDSIAERINEAFAENYGDVILEFVDNEYQIIEDYKEEVAEWLLTRLR